jgi:quinol monooxygenase YgiN
LRRNGISNKIRNTILGAEKLHLYFLKGLSMLTVIATISSENMDADVVLTALENLQKYSRQEVGCLRYELSVKSDAQQTTYLVSEQWASDEHFETHKNEPHFKAFGTQVTGLVTNSNIDVYKSIG